MRRDPFTEWHNPVREAIKERDCLTRFSVAQHPMTRYPGFTVQEVRDAVERDLLRLPQKITLPRVHIKALSD